MSIQEDISWFKSQFQEDIITALADTPFRAALLTAIALQETGYLWRNIYKRETVAKTLELCVGDTIDSPNRRAFPKDKAALLEHENGAQMFAIAREALESIAIYNNDYQRAARNIEAGIF